MNTLFDKIWDAHVVQKVEDGPTQLYIDRLYCHEVTSPQAFSGLRERGIKCFRPEKIFCMPDHNTPTHDQDKPIEDPVSKTQVDTLAKNAEEFGLAHFGMMDKKNGIIHVVGPERGLTLPGMTIVCGDSHTSTHGAMGAVAFGIGTSEVEMVMASQCILQTRPKTMRITVDGKLGKRSDGKRCGIVYDVEDDDQRRYGIFRGICRRSCAQSDYGRPSDLVQSEYRDGCPRRYGCSG